MKLLKKYIHNFPSIFSYTDPCLKIKAFIEEKKQENLNKISISAAKLKKIPKKSLKSK